MGPNEGIRVFVAPRDSSGERITSKTITFYTNTERPEVSTIDYENVGNTYATLIGEITSNGGTGITDYGFIYSTSKSTLTIDTGIKVSCGSAGSWKGEYSKQINGLERAKKYFFTAYATNAEGTSYGRQNYFTTTCDHSLTYDSINSLSYKSISSTQHQMTTSYNKVCSYCYATIAKAYRSDTQTEQHDFNSINTCIDCGYAKGCSHSNTSKEYYEQTYEILDETYHKYNHFYRIVCVDCGVVVDSKVMWDEQEQKHTFSNGVCTKCGYVKAKDLSVTITPRQNTASVGTSIGADAVAIGGSGGYKYAYTLYRDNAVVSSLEFSEGITYYSYRADKPGNYKFEVTVRDSKNTQVSATSTTIVVGCAHETYGTDMFNLTSTVEYEQYNDVQHYTVYYYDWVCKLCGETYKSHVTDDANRVLQNHVYDSTGKCTLCGLKCQHETIKNKKVAYSVTNTNNYEQHSVTAKVSGTCSSCNNALTLEETYEESHEGNGKIVLKSGGFICACQYEYGIPQTGARYWVKQDESVYSSTKGSKKKVGTVYGADNPSGPDQVTVFDYTWDGKYAYIEYSTSSSTKGGLIFSANLSLNKPQKTLQPYCNLYFYERNEHNQQVENNKLYATGLYAEVYDMISALNGSCEKINSKKYRVRLFSYYMIFDATSLKEGETTFNVEIYEGGFKGDNNAKYVGKTWGTYEYGMVFANVKKCAELGKAYLEKETTSTVIYRAVDTTGGEVPYILHFRSEVTHSNLEHAFYYSDDYFAGSSNVYNHKLAKLSLGMALAGFTGANANNWTSESVQEQKNRRENIEEAYNTLHFTGAEYHNYEKSLSDYSAKVAYSFAKKEIVINGKKTTVVAVVVRGGGYGAEWSSNFKVESKGLSSESHFDWTIAKSEVFSNLFQYLSNVDGDYKVWITGFSRGAAVANLLAKDMTDRLGEKRVYAYCFACPKGTKDKNWDKYNNIFSIVNTEDIVPKVPLYSMGYSRYGKTLLYTTASNNSNGPISKMYKTITKGGSYFQLGTHNTNSIINVLERLINDSKEKLDEDVYYKLQIVLQDLFAAVNQGGDYMGYLTNPDCSKIVVSLVETYCQNKYDISDAELQVIRQDLNYGNAYEQLLSIYGTLGGKIGTIAVMSTKDYIGLVEDICYVVKLLFRQQGLLLSSFFTKKLGNILSMWIDLSGSNLKQEHYGEVYLSCMEVCEPVYIPDQKRVVSLACPINVNIYSSTGNLVCSIVNDEVVFGIIPITVDSGRKEIVITGDDEYKIEIIATDNGKMDYSISYLDNENCTVRKICYNDVLLTKGTVYEGNCPSDSSLEASYYDLLCQKTDDDQFTISYSEDRTGDLLNDVTVYAFAAGNGLVSGLGLYTSGDYVTVTATSKNDAEFVGWYQNGELITGEASYSFVAKEDVFLVAKFDSKTSDSSSRVTSISLQDLTLYYKDGGAILTTVNTEGNADYVVSYNVANPKILSVAEDGTVNTLHWGKTDVTVTVTDTRENTFTETCTVEVKCHVWQWLIIIFLFGWIWY